MPVMANRAWMSTTGTGTATSITLGSAQSGYQTFGDAGIATGNSVHYTIIDGASWEIGTGTYTSAGTLLERTTVIESSNSDALISLSGSATVFIAALASDIIRTDVANTWTAVQGYAESAITWTATTTASWDVSTKPVATLAVGTATAGTEMGAPTNVTAGRYYSLRFTQTTSTSPLTITWASNYHFISNTAPTLTTTAGYSDHFTFYGRASNILEEVGRAQGHA